MVEQKNSREWRLWDTVLDTLVLGAIICGVCAIIFIGSGQFGIYYKGGDESVQAAYQHQSCQDKTQ